jgi:hypothetical protein
MTLSIRSKKAPAAPAVPQIRFRDRILELRRVKASELLENPANWRRHSEEQVGAVTSIMERIGFAGAAIGRLKDGKIQLLDGHLRRSIAAQQEVPVLITDLDDEEAKIFLASYDPLSSMAITDARALVELLKGVSVEDDAYLRKLMVDAEQELMTEATVEAAQQKEIEGMNLEPHEHYDYLVVMAQTSNEWNVLCERLGLKPEARRKGMGTARAIRATRLLEKLQSSK